ncbi:restriction endonuclease subunit S [Marinicellulosiphila megalodicopiae]|uniref:restriction endonuclease subunit S n=1 Tax=Marinicellulosiphila megalodicopiae TaxID=2724896 RepID=UPI003BAF9E8A
MSSKNTKTSHNLITDNMDLWTSTLIKKSTQGRGSSKKIDLYGIKKLRELILELAVRGKLVDQDPSDEPACILLERISVEKAQLVADGKIKKTKALPEISEDEKPFDLPDGWEWVRLKDIANIYNGNSVNAQVKELKYSNGNGLPYIGTKDIGYGFESINYNNGVNIPENEPKFKIANKGTVLICAEGGSAGKKCAITMNKIYFGNKLFANELFSGVIPKYLLTNILTPTFYTQFSNSMTGIIGGISTLKYLELIIPIAPEQEQNRIVKKVDELMLLCDKLEQQTEDNIDAHNILATTLLDGLTNVESHEELLENWNRIADNFDILFSANPQGELALDHLKQTILQLAVMGKLTPQDPNDEPASELLKRIAIEKEQLIKDGKIKKQKPLPEISENEKPFELPDGWEWCRLDDLTLQSGAGWSPKCNGSPREGNNWGVLKVSAVTWGVFQPNENKELPSHLEPRPEHEIKKNDFLISRANTPELVARSVVVPENTEAQLMMSDKIIRFKFSQYISPDYVSMVNNSQWSKDYYAKVAGGTSSTMKNVSRTQIQMLLTALPPYKEQKRIMSKVEGIMALCNNLKEIIRHSSKTNVQMTDYIVKLGE